MLLLWPRPQPVMSQQVFLTWTHKPISLFVVTVATHAVTQSQTVTGAEGVLTGWKAQQEEKEMVIGYFA